MNGTVHVRLFGPKHSGKTMLLYVLHRFLDRALRVVEISAGMQKQAEQITHNKEPERTGKDEEESITVHWQDEDRNLIVTSYPGEIIYTPQGGVAIEPLLKQYFEEGTSLLVAVVNPFLSNRNLAYRALLDVVNTLQNRLNFTMGESIRIAVQVLFHLDNPESLNIEYNQGRLNGLTNARLTYHEDQTAFGWQNLERADRDWLTAMLQRLTHTVVERQRVRYLDPLKQIIGAIKGRAVVVLTHMDLDRYAPHIRLIEFADVLDDLFDANADRLKSQEVLAGNVEIRVRADVQNPVVYLNQLQEGAQQLWRSIKLRASDVPHSAVAPAQFDRLGWGDLLRTAVYSTLQLFPIMVVLLLLWALEAQTLGWVPLGDRDRSFPATVLLVLAWGVPVVFLVACGAAWLHAHYCPPRWTLRRSTLALRPALVGTAEDSPLNRVRLHTSVLGQGLDQGWATVGDNRVRGFRLPQFSQLRKQLGPGVKVMVHWWRDLLLIAALVAVVVLAVVAAVNGR